MTGFAKGMAVAVALAFSSQAFAQGAAPAVPATKAGGTPASDKRQARPEKKEKKVVARRTARRLAATRHED